MINFKAFALTGTFHAFMRLIKFCIFVLVFITFLRLSCPCASAANVTFEYLSNNYLIQSNLIPLMIIVWIEISKIHYCSSHYCIYFIQKVISGLCWAIVLFVFLYFGDDLVLLLLL